jgi:serine/threonine protein kinase
VLFRSTSKFDVWQFGILLLYLTTGFLPESYGCQLLKHISEFSNNLQISENLDKFAEPPIYPRFNFFYDWLKGCKMVNINESVNGQSGECFISSEKPNVEPSILELEFLHLFPYRNTKVKYDETKLFLEIIAMCLQIDPIKRPTIEYIMRSYAFNQNNQVSDILDSYLKSTRTNMFLCQFIAPTLHDLNDDTFRFTLGTVTALLFHEDTIEDDIPFAFPLDNRSAERVLAALINLRIINKLVQYVLDFIHNKVHVSDVLPIIKFKDSNFESLLHFFTRFVAFAEHSQGVISNYVNEVILSLLCLYTGNPFLNRSSSELLSNKKESRAFINHDSAPLFLYTNAIAHPLVRYVLQWTNPLMGKLNRTLEHNDHYFGHFLSFSDAVVNFANAICHGIETQKMNGIKSMAVLWGNDAELSTVRLFLDFGIPQKIVHCFHVMGCRQEASSLLLQILNASTVRNFEPAFLLLRSAVQSPIVSLFIAAELRKPHLNGRIRQLDSEILKNII